MMKLLLVGGTGLVGENVLRMALADKRISHVIAPTRLSRPLSFSAESKLHNPLVDFDNLPTESSFWQVDAVVCCLGTTIKQAGSRAAFYKVDHDYPMQIARLAFDAGARSFALNSALGADANSNVFYSRTKGELERDLITLGFPSLTFVRPGLIGGKRQMLRPAEAIAVKASLLINAILPKRYRVVSASGIARCLLDAAIQAKPGMHIVMSESIE